MSSSSPDARTPLEGKTVVVTRAPHQADELKELLEARGARVLVHPTIRIRPPADPRPLRRSTRRLAWYDWLIFTSVNGVAAFRQALDDTGQKGEPPPMPGLRTCAIGPATARAMQEELGLRADVVPGEYVAEAVLRALEKAASLEGRRVLLPRAAEARDVLPEGLEARGAMVDVVEAYRTEAVEEGADELRERLAAGEVDLLTFTASSTVRNFAETVGSDVGRARVAVIGPVTATTARELGIRVDAVAEEYTIPGLVDACAARTWELDS